MPTRIRRLLAVTALAACVIACAGPSTPDGPQVLVQVIDDAVVLTPAVVPAGTIRFIVDGAVGKASPASFQFVARSGGHPDERLPLLEGDVERLRFDPAPEGMVHDTGWGVGATMELGPGQYIFMVPGPDGGMLGTPPESVTVLTVTE